MNSKQKGNIVNVVVIGAAATALGILIVKARKKPTPTPTPSGTANLSGVVSDNAGPVSSAEVMVGTISTFTDSTGHYSLKLLAVGSQGIIISKNGYTTFSATITLVAGDNEENALLTLANPNTPAPKGNVSGIVTNSVSGQPIEGAIVYLESGVLQTVTDQAGSFAFSDVGLGVYDFSVVKSGYDPLSQAVTVIEGSNEFDVQLVPVPVVTTGLIINTAHMPDILWSGQITDLSNGQVQSWGVQNVNLPVNLNKTNGKQVLLQYNVGSATNYDEQTVGPLLITMPDTQGTFVFDGAALTLGGVHALDLPSSNNLQTLKGNLASYNPDAGFITMSITDSIAVGSYQNVGQYLIGQTMTVYLNRNLPSNVGGALQITNCALTYYNPPGSNYTAPMFVMSPSSIIEKQRPFPDSAYTGYSGSLQIESELNPEFAQYPDWAGAYLKYALVSVSGPVNNFSCVVVGMGTYGYYDIVAAQFRGPASNAKIYIDGFQGDDIAADLWVNPDPNAQWGNTGGPGYDPTVDGWVFVDSHSLSG